MKQCKTCGQILSQKIKTCPGCGSHIVDGIKFIDDYRILAIIHEGYSSLVCKAIKEHSKTPVAIRLFVKESGVTDRIAKRLKKELEELKDLPAETHNSWYGIISKHLVSGIKEDKLIKLTEKKPEKLLTLHTALGLWAEGDQNREKASHHYREALSSYLDNWNEYDLALGRIMHFRQSP